MNNFITSLLIILFSITNSYSQSKYSFIAYHEKVNLAELSIAKKEYKNALDIYQHVFEEYPHAFYKDYHNASLCALKEKDFENAFNYSKILVLHGYEMKDFEMSAFEELRDYSKVWQLFLSEYPHLRKEYENSINLPLREKYLELFKIDQKAASSNNIKSQDSIFNKIAYEISELMKNDGFPHWFINKDTINFRIQTMLRHYCGLNNRIELFEGMQKDSFYIKMQDCKIDSLVYRALKEGWLMPEQYVSITTYYQSPNPYGKLAVMVDYEKETVKLNLPVSQEEENEINERRINIGMATVIGLSDEMLIGTKWNHFPFKQIKEAWAACDTCEWSDYNKIAGDLELEIEDEYIKNNRCDFILNDYNSINEIWFTNTQEFQKNKIKLEDYDFDNQ